MIMNSLKDVFDALQLDYQNYSEYFNITIVDNYPNRLYVSPNKDIPVKSGSKRPHLIVLDNHRTFADLTIRPELLGNDIQHDIYGNRPVIRYKYNDYKDLYDYTKGKINLCLEKSFNSPINSDDIDHTDIEKEEKKMFDKNIILYGPPGTGKTYNSVNYAVAIIEGKSENEIKAEDRKKVINRYKGYISDGRIAFTTFHQSYGYEDFIEGIRPVVDGSEDDEADDELISSVKYKIEKGIFKKFCNDAPIKTGASSVASFDTAWSSYYEDVLKNGCKDTLDNIDIEIHGKSFYRVYPNTKNCLSKEKAKNQWLGLIKKENRESSTFLGRQAIIEKLKSDYGLVDPSDEKNIPTNNRVFIIDEINRGNISKIFGELITLIEPSKRLGAKEETKAILPYSKVEFGVPDNVYIIGTMNTADRSIALIDTALRRRFSFVEMMPDSNAIKVAGKDIIIKDNTGKETDINVTNMLEKINERITALYDREHTIGHSYFMDLKGHNDIDTLGKIFKDKIIPLLQEYFYEDYEKIRLVLGDNQKKSGEPQFITKKDISASTLFGDGDIDVDVAGTSEYTINNDAFKKIDAYSFIK